MKKVSCMHKREDVWNKISQKALCNDQQFFYDNEGKTFAMYSNNDDNVSQDMTITNGSQTAPRGIIKHPKIRKKMLGTIYNVSGSDQI